MQTELVEKQSVSATFKVTVPAPEVDAAFDRVLAQLARQVRVPGFRPGKAPRGVLIKRVGAEALADEVREHLVDDHYPKAVRELELLPVHAHFHGDAPVEGQDFTFEVHADLYPEFELPDLDGIGIDASTPELDEEQVTRTVERLRDEHATLVPVERPIEAGDVLFVTTLGEGGGSSMPIDLGRTERGIVEQLLGRSMGDELTLDLGEGSSLQVRVEDVKAKELPDTDDAFAQTLGFDDWDAALVEIRSGLVRQLERETESRQREEFVDKLVDATRTEVPRALVQRRRAALLSDLADDLRRRQGMSIEAYVKALEEGGRRQEFESELQGAAERGVKRDLVLEALLERRGTTISDEEFDAALRHLAARDGKDVRRFREELGDDGLRNYRFLLARDRAVREIVAEKTGRAGATGIGDASDLPDPRDASSASDAGGHEHGGHEHDGHDHEGHEHRGHGH